MAQLPDIDDPVTPVDSGGREATSIIQKVTLGIHASS